MVEIEWNQIPRNKELDLLYHRTACIQCQKAIEILVDSKIITLQINDMPCCNGRKIIMKTHDVVENLLKMGQFCKFVLRND